MALPPEQLATLKADVLANADTLAAYNTGDFATLASLYNADAAPVASVWNDATPVNSISNAIDGTKYSPADAPDGTLLYNNRCFLIQIKQSLLNNILQSPFPFDATLSINRANLKDATTKIPAGAAGTDINPGGASGTTVLTACLRSTNCSRFEKVFSAGSQTTGTVTAEVLTLIGPVDPSLFVDV